MVSSCPSRLGASAESRCLRNLLLQGVVRGRCEKGWLWSSTNFLSECRLMVLPRVLY